MFVIAFFTYNYVTKNLQNEAYFTKVYTQRTQEVIKSMQKESKLLKESWKRDRDSIKYTSTEPFAFYIFKDKELSYWTEYRIIIPYDSIKNKLGAFVGILPQGKFLIYGDTIIDKQVSYQTVMLFQLEFEPKVTNRYLTRSPNPTIFPESGISISINPKDKNAVFSQNNEYLYSLSYYPNFSLITNSSKILLVGIIGLSILIFVLYVILMVRKVARQINVELGLFILCAGLLLIRAIMILEEFPFSIFSFDLFNPFSFYSSTIFPSLGDLILNILAGLIVILFVFLYYPKLKFLKWAIALSYWKKNLLAGLFILISYLLLFYFYELFITIQRDSDPLTGFILDINQVQSISFIVIIGIFVFIPCTIIYFLLSHICFQIYIQILGSSKYNTILHFIVSSLLLNISLVYWPDVSLPIFVAHALYFLVIYYLKLSDYLIRIRFDTFLYLFITTIIASFTAAQAIYDHSKIELINNKERYATKLSLGNDPDAEFLLNKAKEKIQADVFIKSKLVDFFSSKEAIVQKIKRKYIPNYFDKYDIQVYIFNARGKPYNINNISADYDYLAKNFGNQDYKILEYDDLYFVSELGSSISRRYFQFLEIRRRKRLIGYIILDLKLKKIIPNSIYPELIVQKQFSTPESFSYAIYDKDELTYSYGEIQYPESALNFNLRRSILFTDGIKLDGVHHFGVEVEQGNTEKIIIVSSKAYGISHFLANFAYFFLFITSLIILSTLIYALFYSFKRIRLNLTTKIQLYLNTAFFIPSLIISIILVTMLNQTFQNDSRKAFYEKAKPIVNNLSSLLDDMIKQDELAEELNKISRFAEIDINVFDKNGRLIQASQPLIHEYELLSSTINPNAYFQLTQQEKDYVILNEQLGKFTYKAIYMVIKSNQTGEMLGILNVPFFESKKAIESGILAIWISIMRIFAFVFIFLLALSYLTTRVLTLPLRFITQQIKKISLSGDNEPISWNVDDEIGLMVGEYNAMLIKLEESKKALAASEKESAWREMAKQVAHEIKNPLTPMKLNLQQMLRVINSENTLDVKQTTQKINNLLAQIDTLSDIATSFSSFAKMPVPVNELMEVGAVVKQVVSLFNTNTDGTRIELNMPNGKFYILSDAKLIQRILSNLIINAQQSIPSGRIPQIKLNITISDDHATIIIALQDNGTGIPETIRKKVFIPNFSTKYTGSGLGLAIAKRGIEHGGGKIWFDTVLDEGTTFFIKMPLHHFEEFKKK